MPHQDIPDTSLGLDPRSKRTPSLSSEGSGNESSESCGKKGSPTKGSDVLQTSRPVEQLFVSLLLVYTQKV